jgi:hypothetical protein
MLLTRTHGKDFLSFLVSHHRFSFTSFLSYTSSYIYICSSNYKVAHIIWQWCNTYHEKACLSTLKYIDYCISLAKHDDMSVYLFFPFFFFFFSLSSIVIKLTFYISFSFICRLEFISHAWKQLWAHRSSDQSAAFCNTKWLRRWPTIDHILV